MLLNLTPHDVIIVNGEGETALTIRSSGSTRVTMARVQVGSVEESGVEIPVFQAKPGEVENLPDRQDGVYLIVSRVVAEAARERDDLLIPDDAVRDDQGRIIGCRALARV